jgi:dihydrofolate synthase / folylpolyglutamate synthase
MATLLCVAHGLTTGTFISPHLERVEERFAVNGVTPTSSAFVQAVDRREGVRRHLRAARETLTYFELTAALAVSWFADQAVDAAVIEVGLGWPPRRHQRRARPGGRPHQRRPRAHRVPR